MNAELTRVMNHNPIFCTTDTRIAEIKHLLKKYDYEELVVVDSAEQKHPVGLVSLQDVSTEEVESSDIPSDVSAAECMRTIPSVVADTSSLEECMNIMRANHLDRIPVVDFNGHLNGLLDREEVAKILLF